MPITMLFQHETKETRSHQYQTNMTLLCTQITEKHCHVSYKIKVDYSVQRLWKNIFIKLNYYLLNVRWTGFTRPQQIVGRVYPSNLAIYPSKGRVDGSLDETVRATHVPHTVQPPSHI